MPDKPLLFDHYTQKNHSQLVHDAIAKATRQLADVGQSEKNLYRPDGWPKYSPAEEAERRRALQAKREEIITARDQVITNAREVAERGIRQRQAQIDRIKAKQESPMGRLHGTDAPNMEALVRLLEAGFNRSSFADMMAQVSAAMLDSNRDQQVACCEIVQRRMHALQAAVPEGEKLTGVSLAQYNQLEEVSTTLVRKLQDPGLAYEHGDHAAGLRAAQDLLADVRAQERPFRIAENQEKLVASGLYGDRIAGPPVLHNIQQVPVMEMVEQG